MILSEAKMKTAIKRYNGIMCSIGYEHNTINTRYSERTENWNLRDMVAEADYTLSTYYEDGHVNNDMRYSYDQADRKMWQSETEKLKRFIEAYEPYITELTCDVSHCSNYD